LDIFPANIDDYSDQHGGKLHQTLKKFEIYFRTKSKISMLVRWYDYCVTEMKFLIPPDPHSTATNFSTKMAHDDASLMDKFVNELESSLVQLTQLKTQVERRGNSSFRTIHIPQKQTLQP